jgi:hypothetical protein
LEAFVLAGFVSGLDELNALPEQEFEQLCNAIVCDDRGDMGRYIGDTGLPGDAAELPDQTPEERIRALKVPKGGINVMEALDEGRRIAQDLIRQHNETTKNEILNSHIPTLR